MSYITNRYLFEDYNEKKVKWVLDSLQRKLRTYYIIKFKKSFRYILTVKYDCAIYLVISFSIFFV